MHSKNFVEFVKGFNEFKRRLIENPKSIESIYGDTEGARGLKPNDVVVSPSLNKAETQEERRDNFISNLEVSLDKSRVFEISDGVKKLLCLTDTPLKNDEINLPFETMFLDVDFTKEELAELGIEIVSDKIIGAIVREGVLQDDSGTIYGKDLNITILQVHGDEWYFDVFHKNANLNEEYEDRNFDVLEANVSDKKGRDFVHKFVLNFLNFVNNPEVELVEHLRSAKNRERRAKQGKPIIPSSYKINIYGKLRQYIDDAMNGEGWSYGYRFWVRGHFRDLKSERYINKKRIWVLPFIKGKGVLIEKSYEVKIKETKE